MTHPNVALMGEVLRDVETKIMHMKREKRAWRWFHQQIRLQTKFFLNGQKNRGGVFEDKYYHFINIGVQFPPTNDHSLNTILFNFFLAKITGEV